MFIILLEKKAHSLEYLDNTLIFSLFDRTWFKTHSKSSEQTKKIQSRLKFSNREFFIDKLIYDLG